MNRLFFIIVFFTFFLQPNWAQDKLTFLNGQVLQGKSLSCDSSYVEFSFYKRKKSRTELFENYRLYSLTDSSGKETILYRQDSITGNVWTPTEAMYLVHGEQDALSYFKPHLSNVGGLAFALGVSLFDTYEKQTGPNDGFFEGFFRSSPGILHLISPFVYTFLVGIPGISIDLSKISNRSYLMEPAYREGFVRVVKNKRKFGGLKFSLIGSAAGAGLYFLGRSIQ